MLADPSNPDEYPAPDLCRAGSFSSFPPTSLSARPLWPPNLSGLSSLHSLLHHFLGPYYFFFFKHYQFIIKDVRRDTPWPLLLLMI